MSPRRLQSARRSRSSGLYPPRGTSRPDSKVPPASESMASLECLERRKLVEWQGSRVAQLLKHIYGRNAFYTRKLDAAGIQVEALRFPEDLSALPPTTKGELIADQAAHPPWGTILTEPIKHYTRYCQTSSTTGRPLVWIDTAESWQWMLECW